MKKTKENVEKDEGLDFSAIDTDDMFDANLNFGNAIEIDSVEDIDSHLNAINAARDEKVEVPDPKKKVQKPAEPEDEPEAEDEEPEDDEPEKDPDEDEKEEPASPIIVFAEFLEEKGIIERKEGENFEDNEEYLVEKIKEQIQGGIDEYKNSLKPETREILDAIEAGIPAEMILQRNAAIDTYESITDDEIEENEALQKSLLRNLYKLNGYSNEVIEKKIKRFDDAGLLSDEAKEARMELLEMTRQQKEEIKRQQAEAEKNKIAKFQEWKDGIKTTLSKTDEIIPGFKITEAQKKAVHETLTEYNKDGKNKLQQMAESDPDFNLKVAYIAAVLKWDFSKFEKRAETAAAKRLRESIADSDKLRSSGREIFSANKNQGSINVSVIEKALRQK